MDARERRLEERKKAFLNRKNGGSGNQPKEKENYSESNTQNSDGKRNLFVPDPNQKQHSVEPSQAKLSVPVVEKRQQPSPPRQAPVAVPPSMLPQHRNINAGTSELSILNDKQHVFPTNDASDNGEDRYSSPSKKQVQFDSTKEVKKNKQQEYAEALAADQRQQQTLMGQKNQFQDRLERQPPQYLEEGRERYSSPPKKQGQFDSTKEVKKNKQQEYAEALAADQRQQQTLMGQKNQFQDRLERQPPQYLEEGRERYSSPPKKQGQFDSTKEVKKNKQQEYAEALAADQRQQQTLMGQKNQFQDRLERQPPQYLEEGRERYSSPPKKQGQFDSTKEVKKNKQQEYAEALAADQRQQQTLMGQKNQFQDRLERQPPQYLNNEREPYHAGGTMGEASKDAKRSKQEEYARQLALDNMMKQQQLGQQQYQQQYQQQQVPAYANMQQQQVPAMNGGVGDRASNRNNVMNSNIQFNDPLGGAGGDSNASKQAKMAKQREYAEALRLQQLQSDNKQKGNNYRHRHNNAYPETANMSVPGLNPDGTLSPGWVLGPMGQPVRQEVSVGNRKIAAAYNQVHSPGKQQPFAMAGQGQPLGYAMPTNMLPPGYNYEQVPPYGQGGGLGGGAIGVNTSYDGSIPQSHDPQHQGYQAPHAPVGVGGAPMDRYMMNEEEQKKLKWEKEKEIIRRDAEEALRRKEVEKRKEAELEQALERKVAAEQEAIRVRHEEELARERALIAAKLEAGGKALAGTVISGTGGGTSETAGGIGEFGGGMGGGSDGGLSIYERKMEGEGPETPNTRSRRILADREKKRQMLEKYKTNASAGSPPKHLQTHHLDVVEDQRVGGMNDGSNGIHSGRRPTHEHDGGGMAGKPHVEAYQQQRQQQLQAPNSPPIATKALKALGIQQGEEQEDNGDAGQVTELSYPTYRHSDRGGNSPGVGIGGARRRDNSHLFELPSPPAGVVLGSARGGGGNGNNRGSGGNGRDDDYNRPRDSVDGGVYEEPDTAATRRSKRLAEQKQRREEQLLRRQAMEEQEEEEEEEERLAYQRQRVGRNGGGNGSDDEEEEEVSLAELRKRRKGGENGQPQQQPNRPRSMIDNGMDAGDDSGDGDSDVNNNTLARTLKNNWVEEGDGQGEDNNWVRKSKLKDQEPPSGAGRRKDKVNKGGRNKKGSKGSKEAKDAKIQNEIDMLRQALEKLQAQAIEGDSDVDSDSNEAVDHKRGKGQGKEANGEASKGKEDFSASFTVEKPIVVRDHKVEEEEEEEEREWGDVQGTEENDMRKYLARQQHQQQGHVVDMAGIADVDDIDYDDDDVIAQQRKIKDILEGIVGDSPSPSSGNKPLTVLEKERLAVRGSKPKIVGLKPEQKSSLPPTRDERELQNCLEHGKPYSLTTSKHHSHQVHASGDVSLDNTLPSESRLVYPDGTPYEDVCGTKSGGHTGCGTDSLDAYLPASHIGIGSKSPDTRVPNSSSHHMMQTLPVKDDVLSSSVGSEGKGSASAEGESDVFNIDSYLRKNRRKLNLLDSYEEGNSGRQVMDISAYLDDVGINGNANGNVSQVGQLIDQLTHVSSRTSTASTAPNSARRRHAHDKGSGIHNNSSSSSVSFEPPPVISFQDYCRQQQSHQQPLSVHQKKAPRQTYSSSGSRPGSSNGGLQHVGRNIMEDVNGHARNHRVHHGSSTGKSHEYSNEVSYNEYEDILDNLLQPHASKTGGGSRPWSGYMPARVDSGKLPTESTYDHPHQQQGGRRSEDTSESNIIDYSRFGF